MGVDGLPMGVDGLPMGVDGLPMGVDGLPMGVDGLPMGVDGQLLVYAGVDGLGGFQGQWNGLFDGSMGPMGSFTFDDALMVPFGAPFGWDESSGTFVLSEAGVAVPSLVASDSSDADVYRSDG
jgi:hypothetical protein